jgi:catechol 2,3-dioxygenase-like lactoylglutathione lyase family enzyme
MAAFRVQELLHVNVEVTDLERALAFYRLFDLEELERLGTPGRAGAWFRLGDGRELHLSVGPARPAGRTHFAILVDDVAAARAVFTAAGAPIESEREIPGIDRFFTRDPDGNRIEIQGRSTAAAAAAEF